MKIFKFSILFCLFCVNTILGQVSHSKSSIFIVYGYPLIIPKVNWNDGFIAAISILEKKYSISWFLTNDIKQKRVKYDEYDLIFVKSAWGAECEVAVRRYLPN